MTKQLINRNFIYNVLMNDAPWANSHGAWEDYLGMGLIYYTIVYIKKAQTAVCLGSGGGFVPRLMRQAQRDLGIADHSRTILVDANRPEAGWSAPLWLDKDSFFRSHYSDIELIIKTSQEAAENYFADQRINIDYLHIDADHSLQACLDDFKSFRPFLKKGAIVTLHDTNFAGAGVRHVVSYIRARNDCEVIDFPEMGAGTALVRITNDHDAIDFQSKSRRFGSNSDAVIITSKPNISYLDPPVMTWKYLETEAFSTRSVIAAHFLKNCPSVIEIGGAKTPIHQFLTGNHENVIVLDPFIHEGSIEKQNGATCRILHIRACFQDVIWEIQRPKDYGLVMLGMELQGLSNDDYQALFQLVNNARITVIEFPPSWGPSRDQFHYIDSNTHTKLRFTCELNYTGNYMGDLETSWPPRFDRKIYVLEPV